jgi:serine/threonine-protein kinase
MQSSKKSKRRERGSPCQFRRRRIRPERATMPPMPHDEKLDPYDLTRAPTLPPLPGRPDRDTMLSAGPDATAGGLDTEDLPVDVAFHGRYRVAARLGEGGMGVVHLVRDARIGREVAMKVAREAQPGSSGGQRPRFLREARVQGQLEHPAIVPVYDLGRDPQGAVYFTMKRVHGLTIEEILDGLRAGEPAVAAYSRRKLLTAFGSVCLAVDYAHSRGVLHRDLKPGNVMLGDFGEVYLLDWGLAKLVGAAEERAPDAHEIDAAAAVAAAAVSAGGEARTESGAVMGTPGYMAPEQAMGAADLDARADVYALGAMLFELLTLQRLHPADSTHAQLVSTLRGVEARPSLRAPEREVPPELEALLVQATALRPEDRTPSARALSEAIERFLDGDRDLALRRELASVHARTAGEAAERVKDGSAGFDEHGRAMREVGRAIALDPGNREALRTLALLLTEPPRAIPDEVRREMDASARVNERVAGRLASVAYFGWVAFVPLLFAMGIRNMTWAVTIGVLWTVASVASLVDASKPRRAHVPWVPFVASSLAIAGTTGMFGAMFYLPTIAAANGLSFLSSGRRSLRVAVIAGSCLTMLLPFALELAGVLPPAYAFSGGAMTVLPRIASLPRLPTLVTLATGNLMFILVPGVFMGRARHALQLAEERLRLQAWQLRHLVPDEAQETRAAVLPPARPHCPIRAT